MPISPTVRIRIGLSRCDQAYPIESSRSLKFESWARSRRQHEFVSAGKQLFVLVKNRVSNNRRVLLSTENDAHCRIVFRRSFEIVRHPDVHIHLSDILVVPRSW